METNGESFLQLDMILNFKKKNILYGSFYKLNMFELPRKYPFFKLNTFNILFNLNDTSIIFVTIPTNRKANKANPRTLFFQYNALIFSIKYRLCFLTLCCTLFFFCVFLRNSYMIFFYATRFGFLPTKEFTKKKRC